MEPLLLQAFRNQPLDRPPVWMMRQAGRYLEEYRALKARHSFLELCRSPELAAEVSLQPLRILDVDAVILFSDILIPVQAMGINVDFKPGPTIYNPITSPADIQALKVNGVVSEVSYVFETVKSLKKELVAASESPRKALLGFAGAPWTLACYIIEQGPFKHFHGTQVFAQEHRKAMHLLLEKLTTVVIDYVLSQRESGADAIQLFDTWAGNLSAADYREFALPYTQKIFEALSKHSCPTTLYVNGSSHLLKEMASSGANCLSIDWRIDLRSARALLGEAMVLQGNFDPTKLYRSPEEVRKETQLMISQPELQKGYIANLGHGILPTTPLQSAKEFINTVKEYSIRGL